jgi:hypothetical protein
MTTEIRAGMGGRLAELGFFGMAAEFIPAYCITEY